MTRFAGEETWTTAFAGVTKGEVGVMLLLKKLDFLIVLHKRNNDIWVDFFEGSRERILKDPVFGCEYLMMAWHGIGGYDDEKIFDNESDEALRREIHPKIYEMAVGIKNDRN